MKVLAAALLAVASVTYALGPPVPPLAGPVVDQAGIVDAASRQRIEELAHDLERRTGAEMAVLTMRSVEPLTAFDYGMRVVDAWKLGKKGHDDGLLLLVVLEPRETRFFTGYGLEGSLPDGVTGEILDQHVVPKFRGGHYGEGIYAGFAAAAAIITGEAPPRAPPRAEHDAPPVWVVLLVFLALVVLLALFSDGGSGGSGFRGGRRRGYPSLPYGGPFRGPRLPGGFGGGFGRGGGFGGGGAGRSW